MVFTWIYLTTALFMATQQWRMSPHADAWPRFAISVLYGLVPFLWPIVIGGISSVYSKEKLSSNAGR